MKRWTLLAILGLLAVMVPTSPAAAGDGSTAVDREIEDYAAGATAWQQVASLEPGSVVIYPENDSVSIPSLDAWSFAVAPSLWFPALDGTVGVKGLESDVESDLGDSASPLGSTFSGELELWAGSWGGWLSFHRIDLEADGRGGASGADADVEETIVEAAAAYRFDLGRGWLVEPFAGLRYRSMEIDLDTGSGSRFSGDETWVDPIVGARARVQVNDWLALRLRGDLGGFGVGADSTWNLALGADIRVTDWFSMALGWRLLDTDYEDGTGNDRFKFDARYSGPYLGLLFTF